MHHDTLDIALILQQLDDISLGPLPWQISDGDQTV